MTELRGELDDVLQEGPLTKESLGKLHKMNSFLRESARLSNCGFRESHHADVLLSPSTKLHLLTQDITVALQRNALKTFTFSDGTVIPAGAKIGSPTYFTQRDPKIYENPDVFDGFRFAATKGSSSTDAPPSSAYSMTKTAPELHVFGHGKHAW